MNNFLIVSHGEYAKATLASCEMIAGKLPNIKAIAFKQTMNQDELLNEIEKVAESFDKKPTIIVDIAGGTPANASLRYHQKHPEVKVYSGLCLPLLLAAVMGTPMEEGIKQAQENIAPVGENLDIKKTPAKEKNTEETKPNVRIDERLIHGQVATMWTNALRLTRIMVVGDDIVKNDIQKTALKTACPHGVHLSILTAKGAARRINSGKYQGQTVLVLVKNPSVLRQMFDNGVKLPEINVGNMSTKSDSRQVAKSVAVTAEDVDDFNYLNKQGCHLYHQMVPAEDKEDFMKLLEK
ncbi:PTS mannose/fructose/sorbose transporter subunit IIAB [Lactobacillus taiwanensis]|uniref:PTS mannose/fructose/sorbose transporter subunit IIAB n=1 Tax=Lactobacillus taiwanensis TaxID=508451 RepID=UPI0025AF480E|nr:PTS mannose/fructose/sorbose transporter subunit IIAB [Lactobacillus taiwanensis]